ncbi:unnamed protein product [Rotaria sordida]|uniref:Uncharacterized protein n=1 Tax=Rotaria sordida TaxID=392033 RepID=A0A815VHA7_9BILA|nr:unnamed protein product [Rotaria sordida]CAF1528933.1 unnamed protein product [Rotaria sordida]
MMLFRSLIPNILINAQWAQNGVTVAGGHGWGNATNQLDEPQGLFVDDDQTMVIADYYNHRIIQWKMDDKNGQVVAGGHGRGNRLDQLWGPTDVLIDKETDSLIICDRRNWRVVRWSRRSSTTQGEILIEDIACARLAMDDQRYLYISDTNEDVSNITCTDNTIAIVYRTEEVTSMAQNFLLTSFLIFYSIMNSYVLGQTWLGTYKWTSKCSQSECCCFVDQLTITKVSNNEDKLSFVSGRAGAACSTTKPKITDLGNQSK